MILVEVDPPICDSKVDKKAKTEPELDFLIVTVETISVFPMASFPVSACCSLQLSKYDFKLVLRRMTAGNTSQKVRRQAKLWTFSRHELKDIDHVKVAAKLHFQLQ